MRKFRWGLYFKSRLIVSLSIIFQLISVWIVTNALISKLGVEITPLKISTVLMGIALIYIAKPITFVFREADSEEAVKWVLSVVLDDAPLVLLATIAYFLL